MADFSDSYAIPELDNKGLRDFGLTTGGIVAGLFGLFLPWLFGRPIPYWPWVLASVFVAWGLLAPSSLRPVYRTWMRFGLIIGRIVTPLILSAVFLLVISPVGMIRRFRRRDILLRDFDHDLKSYRAQSKKASRQNLEKPF